jgi:hypothetical protein
LIFIAHRANINGPDPTTENNPTQIIAALQAGWEVEIDVRYLNGRWYLGHDSAQYEIHEQFLNNTRFWCHAKNIEALYRLLSNGCVKVFMHDEDDAVIVADTGNASKWIWTHPKTNQLTNRSIAVMPENAIWTMEQLSRAVGICSDYVANYKRDLNWRNDDKSISIKTNDEPIETGYKKVEGVIEDNSLSKHSESEDKQCENPSG